MAIALSALSRPALAFSPDEEVGDQVRVGDDQGWPSLAGPLQIAVRRSRPHRGQAPRAPHVRQKGLDVVRCTGQRRVSRQTIGFTVACWGCRRPRCTLLRRRAYRASGMCPPRCMVAMFCWFHNETRASTTSTFSPSTWRPEHSLAPAGEVRQPLYQRQQPPHGASVKQEAADYQRRMGNNRAAARADVDLPSPARDVHTGPDRLDLFRVPPLVRTPGPPAAPPVSPPACSSAQGGRPRCARRRHGPCAEGSGRDVSKLRVHGPAAGRTSGRFRSFLMRTPSIPGMALQKRLSCPPQKAFRSMRGHPTTTCTLASLGAHASCGRSQPSCREPVSNRAPFR